MARFDSAIQTALKLIQKNGEQVTWTQTPSEVADPAKPWLPSSGSVVEHRPFVCFLPFDREGEMFLQALGQSEAISGTYYGLMGSVPFTPSKRDVITRSDGTKLNIEYIDLLSPNGQKVLWTIGING